MSSTTPVKHTFIVYAPDKTDPGANARRLAVRPAHIERAATMKQEGYMSASIMSIWMDNKAH